MLMPILKNRSLLPRHFGVIRDQGVLARARHAKTEADAETEETTEDQQEHKQLNLTRQFVASKYVPVLKQALQHTKLQQLEVFQARDASLSCESVDQIIPCLPQGLQKIDLAQNKLTWRCTQTLKTLLDGKKFSSLTELRLSRNLLKDRGAAALLTAMCRQEANVRVLDLSHNLITEKSMQQVGLLLKLNIVLQELYLQWNRICSAGGTALARGLSDNYTLCVLDISHNGLGTYYPTIACGEQLISVLFRPKKNAMRHVDLSYNDFRLEELRSMAPIVAENHSVYGLHLGGNSDRVYTDPRGFLRILDNAGHVEHGILEKRYRGDAHASGISGVRHVADWQLRLAPYDQLQSDNCWICEGWVQHRFEYYVDEQSVITETPVFLHLDCERYNPILMERDDTDPQMQYTQRMLPPHTEIRYFFSNPVQKLIALNVSKRTVSSGSDSSSVVKLRYYNGHRWDVQLPETLNALASVLEAQNVLSQDSYEPLVQALPRDDGGHYNVIRPDKPVWRFSISAFKDYVRDTPELFDKCFEQDWATTRVVRLVKNEEDRERLKTLVQKAYSKIKNCYKYLSGISPSGQTPSVSQNVFTEFVASAGNKVVDGQRLKLRDLDIEFVACNTVVGAEGRHLVNPERQLVRHQFVEIWLRLAMHKYIKQGTLKTASAAFQRLLDEGLMALLQSVEDFQGWREKRYWTAEVDILYQARIDALRGIYNAYAGSRRTDAKKFTNKKFLRLREFEDIWRHLDLFDDLFVERDMALSYYLSMMTQIDELDSERHMQMSFTEFLEALARIAEKYSPLPLDESPENCDAEEGAVDSMTELGSDSQRDLHALNSPRELKTATNNFFNNVFYKRRIKVDQSKVQAAFDVIYGRKTTEKKQRVRNLNPMQDLNFSSNILQIAQKNMLQEINQTIFGSMKKTKKQDSESDSDSGSAD